MGYKFVKNADDGEIYILPDEKEALKNTPSFLKEDETEMRDINECYETNIAIADLQKQLYKKDKELKKATRSVITVDKENLIACFSVLVIILVLAIIIAASIINNNSSPPVVLPEQNVTAEVQIPVVEAPNESDKFVLDDTESKNVNSDKQISETNSVDKDFIKTVFSDSMEKISNSFLPYAIMLLVTSIVFKIIIKFLKTL